MQVRFLPLDWPMHPYWLAASYCAMIAAASLVGGWLPQYVRLTHARMQVAISFVAGVILGIGLLHLVPHGYLEFAAAGGPGPIDRTAWWLLVGFLVMFFLQRLFHFHTHESPDELIDEPDLGGGGPRGILDDATGQGAGAECDHDQVPGHEHGHAHAPANTHSHGHAHASHDGGGHTFTWGGVFFGLAVHSLVDGVTLGAAITAEADHPTGGLAAGMGYFLAVFLHKPFDSLSITSLMLSQGWSSQARAAINVVYALVAPLGVLVFFLGLNRYGGEVAGLLGGTLCFAGGACLCIATSDLLPELQFHSHDRVKLSVALVLGLALAWGLVLVENQGHADHGHHPAAGAAGQRDDSHGRDPTHKQEPGAATGRSQAHEHGDHDEHKHAHGEK